MGKQCVNDGTSVEGELDAAVTECSSAVCECEQSHSEADIRITFSTTDGLVEGRSESRFDAVIREIQEMHIRKMADYGTDGNPYANLRASTSWNIPAWVGTMIRANDKIIRLQSLRKNGRLANESARDSLVDLATYTIAAIVLFDEESEA